MNATTEEFLRDRSTYIGSSDAPAVLNVSPWKSQFRLYQEKIGAFAEEEADHDVWRALGGGDEGHD